MFQSLKIIVLLILSFISWSVFAGERLTYDENNKYWSLHFSDESKQICLPKNVNLINVVSKEEYTRLSFANSKFNGVSSVSISLKLRTNEQYDILKKYYDNEKGFTFIQEHLVASFPIRIYSVPVVKNSYKAIVGSSSSSTLEILLLDNEAADNPFGVDLVTKIISGEYCQKSMAKINGVRLD